MNPTLLQRSDSCDHAYGSTSTFLRLQLTRRSDQPLDGMRLLSTRVTNALSALGATRYATIRALRGSHIKMPLHYHNRIVKEHHGQPASRIGETHHSINPAESCQRLNALFGKYFFEPLSTLPIWRFHPPHDAWQFPETCLNYIGCSAICNPHEKIVPRQRRSTRNIKRDSQLRSRPFLAFGKISHDCSQRAASLAQ